MRIIISPAKKMNIDTDSLPWLSLPVFLSQTEEILAAMQALSYDDLKAIWKCNEQIAQQNYERITQMDLHKMLSPAILSYEGIQYQYMAPNVFSTQEYDYVQEHLYILSGFYGVLHPFDGVTPYRLEMQTKLKIRDAKDLYSYWDNRIASYIFEETDCVINLASKEYSLCVSKYLQPGIRFITCVFGEEKDGKIIEKGTMCKMARGEMVRYMAEHRITDPKDIRLFDRLDYAFDAARSNEETYVFLKRENVRCSWD